MTTIKIWGDFACPFCYMGDTRLEKVMEKMNLGPEEVKIEYKAYELDKEAPEIPVDTMQQHFMKEHTLTAEEAAEQMEHIIRLASHLGLVYNLEGVKVCSTLDAHRLMKLCAERYDAAMVEKLNFALFKANFTDNLMLSDREVLEKIATGVGMKREEVTEILDSDKYTEAVRADEKEIEERDLEFIPYMLFGDGEYLQGVMSNGALQNAIDANIEGAEARI